MEKDLKEYWVLFDTEPQAAIEFEIGKTIPFGAIQDMLRCKMDPYGRTQDFEQL